MRCKRRPVFFWGCYFIPPGLTSLTHSLPSTLPLPLPHSPLPSTLANLSSQRLAGLRRAQGGFSVFPLQQVKGKGKGRELTMTGFLLRVRNCACLMIYCDWNPVLSESRSQNLAATASVRVRACAQVVGGAWRGQSEQYGSSQFPFLPPCVLDLERLATLLLLLRVQPCVLDRWGIKASGCLPRRTQFSFTWLQWTPGSECPSSNPSSSVCWLCYLGQST